MKKVLRSGVVLLLILGVMMSLTACKAEVAEKEAVNEGTVVEKEDRTYYLVSSHQAHPYFADSHLALRYAADYFGVNIVATGPEGWDTKAQSEAIEQAIAKSPSGIITRMWDASPRDAVVKAMAAGIPVIVTEATVEDNGALSFIGLDNYQAGVDTAKELVARAGDSGKVVCMGNWGASNTDAKFAGVKEYLEKNTQWEIVAEVDDKAETSAAIEAAKSVINNYADIDAIIGLDSSTGTGVSIAMEELGVEAGTYTVIVHDRETSTLEYIEQGYINATLINKTATQEYLAILLMEDWNNGGLKNVPISSDNLAAGVNPLPNNIYNSVSVIDASNVKYFKVDNMPKINTKLYNPLC